MQQAHWGLDPHLSADPSVSEGHLGAPGKKGPSETTTQPDPAPLPCKWFLCQEVNTNYLRLIQFLANASGGYQPSRGKLAVAEASQPGTVQKQDKVKQPKITFD